MEQHSCSTYLFHGPAHDLRPGLLGEDLEHGDEGVGERLELVELLEEAEQLHRDRRRDDEQTHGEDDQGAQLAARAEDLVDKVLQHRGGLDQAYHAEDLQEYE